MQKDKEANKKRGKAELTTEYRSFEKSVENSWINRLQNYCRSEVSAFPFFVCTLIPVTA